MRRLLPLFFVTNVAFAAPPDAEAILSAYRVERDEAAKRGPSPAIAAADAIAKQAEAAVKTNPGTAARLARDARWRLPYRPPGLPDHVEKVLGAGRLRHADRVNAIAYGPDGTSVVSASRDGTVKAWDLAAGRERFSYRGLADLGPPPGKDVNDNVLKIASVAWSKENLIAAGGYGEIHLLDATGTRKQTLKGHAGTVKSLAFRPDGARLVSLGDDKTVRVWDVANGTELVKVEPAKGTPNQPAVNSRLEAVAYAPKGDTIALVNADGRLGVYDVSTKDAKLKLGATVVNQAGPAFAVRFTPDGTGLYTSGDGGTPPRLTAGPNPDHTGPVPVAGTVAAVRSFVGHTANRRVGTLDVSPDGTLLVTGSEDQTCRVWEANSGKPLKVFAAHAAEVTGLAIRPDGKEVASADESGVIRVWPLAGVDEHDASTEATQSLWAVAVSPSGHAYATAGADRLVRVYDATGKLTRTFADPKAPVSSLCFLDDETVASAGGDRAAFVWSLKGNGSPKQFPGHASVVLAVAPLDRGKKIVTGSVDRTMKLWDVATGKVLATHDAKSAVCALATRPDSPRIACGTADGWLSVFETTDAGFKRIATTAAHTAGVAAVAARPDGREFVTVGGDGFVRVWALDDANTLAARLTFEPVANPAGTGAFVLSAAAYAPDGKSFAVAGQEGLVRLYDAQTGRESRTLRGATDWVTGLGFAADGKTVYAAGADKAVRRFPLAESDVAPNAGHARPTAAVAVAPDGLTGVTVSADELKWWDLKAGTERLSVPLPPQRINSITFAGPTTVVLGGEGAKLQTVDLDSGKPGKPYSIGGRSVYSVASAHPTAVAVWQERLDSTELVVVSDKTMKGPYPLPGKEKGDQNVLCAALAPDATLAVAGKQGKGVSVIDLTRMRPVGDDWPLYDGSPVDIALSADKTTVFTIDDAGTIKVATLADRKVVATAKAHPKGCNGLVLARSGDRFATLGADGEIKAWDRNAKELRSWVLPVEVKAATFSPDGRRIVTANGDGSAYVLTVP
jgi:WD40 repeat protein